MRRYRQWLLLGVFFYSCLSIAAPVFDIVEDDHIQYIIQTDHSYKLITSLKQKLVSSLAVAEGQYSSITFYPDSEKIHLLKAYVITPQGNKININPNSIFIRPSQASQNSPGFINSQSATIVFPQLQKNAITFVQWEIDKKLGPFGLLEITQPPFFPQVNHYHITVDVPQSVPFYWAASPQFSIKEKKIHDHRIITADLKNQAAHYPEMNMVAQSDVLPYFEFSSFSSWQELGQIWQKMFAQKIIITSELKKLAQSIVKNKQGLNAIKALYEWEINNIKYVDIINTSSSSYMPHTPMEILNNGYGDCKDYSTLLIAFLKTINIDAYPAMVSWSNAYRKYPLPTTLGIDHTIIYLPKYNLFLNPTNIYGSFGELDLMLANKFTLVLANQPFVTTTPQGNSKANKYRVNTEELLSSNGTVRGSDNMELSGSFIPAIKYQLDNALSYQALAMQMLELTVDGGFGSLKMVDSFRPEQPVTVFSNWLSPQAVIMLSKNTYFTMPIGIDFYPLKKFRGYIQESARVYPMAIGAAQYSWTTLLTLPSNFHVNLLPKKRIFSNKAGNYLMEARTEGQQIFLHFSLTINQDVYSAKEYPELKELLYKPVTDYRQIYGINR